MYLVKKILNHSFWLLLGNSVGRIAMFLTNIFAARMLSQETFGQFMMIRSTISMVEGIVSGSLGAPMIKRVAETYGTKEVNEVIVTLFILNTVITIVLSLGLYILAPFIVNNFFLGVSVLIQGLQLALLLLLATALATIVQNILMGFEEFRRLSLAAILTSLLSLPIILMLMKTMGLKGAILGVACYFSIDFVLKYIQLKQVYRIKFADVTKSKIYQEGKRLLIFSAPLVLSVIVYSTAFWYARVLTVNLSDGFKSIAVFDSAFQLLSVIMIITGATTSVALPMLSRNYKNKDSNASPQIFKVNLQINLLISICISSIFILFSKQIMAIYGPEYITGSNILIVLAITAIFFSLSSIYNKLYIANHRNWSILFINIVSSIVLLITLKIEHNDQAKALAFAFLAYYICSFVLYLFFKQVAVIKT